MKEPVRPQGITKLSSTQMIMSGLSLMIKKLKLYKKMTSIPIKKKDKFVVFSIEDQIYYVTKKNRSCLYH